VDVIRCSSNPAVADSLRALCGSVAVVDERAYLQTVRDRLGSAGFRDESPPAGAVLSARRREVKLTRFGLVETVVAISDRTGNSEPEDLRLLGEDIVRFALEGKSKLPLGLGSSLVVYPVLLVDEASSELRQFAGSYAPRHWCVMEFPVVVERNTRSLAMLEHAPLWGAAYYRKTCRDARELLAPA
jgi:hypothetical protein